MPTYLEVNVMDETFIESLGLGPALAPLFSVLLECLKYTAFVNRVAAFPSMCQPLC